VIFTISFCEIKRKIFKVPIIVTTSRPVCSCTLTEKSAIILINAHYILDIIQKISAISEQREWLTEYEAHNVSCYRQRCGCDPMVIGFTTTYAISAYHH
jgi:hypothetical protein